MMRDRDDRILYIGKSKSCAAACAVISVMAIPSAPDSLDGAPGGDIEFIVTDSEAEA